MSSQKTLLRIVNKGVSFPSKHNQQQKLELAQKITHSFINSTGPNYFKPLHSMISCITHHVLSDSNLSPHSCLAFFNFLGTQHSHTALKPDLKAHVILLSRLFDARKFFAVKSILNYVVASREIHCPVSGIVSLVDECEPHFVKMCDMLFRVCSDNRLFQEAFRVYDYVEGRGLVIEARS